MIEAIRAQRNNFSLEEIDISGSDELFGRYGERIPVLQHADGSELCWPFYAAELIAFVDS